MLPNSSIPVRPTHKRKVCAACQVYVLADIAFAGAEPHWALQGLRDVSKLLHQYVPGLVEGRVLFARANFLSGHAKSALKIVAQAIKTDPNSTQIYLLQAQVQIYLGELKAAGNSLETCVGYNFAVRSDPLYHLLKAKCDRAEGNLADAASALATAMTLLVEQSSSGPNPASQSPKFKITTGQRLGIYLDTAELQVESKELSAAAETLQKALIVFPSSSYEEVRIKIALAHVDLQRGKTVDTVIASLAAITPGLYSAESVGLAKMTLADVYLTHKRDRKAYIRCFQEYAQQSPGNAEALVMLGDAYMTIQEPADAIRVFEKVSEMFPDYAEKVAAKIGQAWISTHNFLKVGQSALMQAVIVTEIFVSFPRL